MQTPSIVVASKDYTEQLILGNIVKLLLENAGFEVEDRIGLGGSRVVREAMLQGEVDVYVELTGSALAVHNGLPSSALPTDADKAYELAKSLDERNGIIWLQRGLFNDTYALMARDDLIDQGLASISDLADYMNANDAPLSICVESDFYGRPFDGLLAMQEQYGFAFKDENVLLMDLDGVYDGLRNGDCDVAEGYSTDGRQNAWGFTNLVDNLAFFPFYNPAPVVRREVLDASPEIADILGAFGAYLDDAAMSQLNARVDLGADGAVGTGDEELPANVALSFLEQANLLTPSDQNVGLASEITTADRQYDGAELLREALSLVVELGRSGQLEAPQIIVGSKDSAEQLLLGQLLVLLLEDIGYDVVDKTGLGDSTTTREALRNGDIDLYIELTGTALSVYHNLPNSALPSSQAQAFSLAQRLDQARNLIWLQPGKFNETQTLVVAPASVDAELASITDLALYMNENESPLTLCVDTLFFEDAQNGLSALEEVYGFNFNPDNILVMAADETFDALQDARCDGRQNAWALPIWSTTWPSSPSTTPPPWCAGRCWTPAPKLPTFSAHLAPIWTTRP
ncbi:MAG: glycine betaine ABC transporter substrate-binding protein [Caldilineaceae bacterium]